MANLIFMIMINLMYISDGRFKAKLRIAFCFSFSTFFFFFFFLINKIN